MTKRAINKQIWYMFHDGVKLYQIYEMYKHKSSPQKNLSEEEINKILYRLPSEYLNCSRKRWNKYLSERIVEGR